MPGLTFTSESIRRIATPLMLCCTAIAIEAFAATDAVFIEPGGRDATSYSSDHGMEARLRGISSAESDARPGEYYFSLGAEAFRKRDYVHAIEMYQVAASWAFKPAEYNLGVMYARGQGIAVDLPRAMAWLALAAERDEPHYVDAREAVYAELSKEQFEQANVIWRDLKKTYGDEIALRRAKARWAEARANITGSRVGQVGNLQVGIPNPNGGDASVMKMTPPIKAVFVGQGGVYVNSMASSAAEATGGEGVDGSIAYRQLLESDNPYDPKFDRNALGKATVGPLTEIKADGKTEKPAQDSEPPKQDP